MLRQLALEAWTAVRPAPPRLQLAQVLEACLVLTPVGAAASFAATRSRAAAALGAAAGCWLALALGLTVLRGGYAWSLTGLERCAVTQPLLSSGDGLTNLLLFAPSAFLAVLAVRRAALVVLALGLLSLVVEAVQALSSVGVCDTSDLLLNVTGAALAGTAAVAARAALGRPDGDLVPGSGPCRRSS